MPDPPSWRDLLRHPRASVARSRRVRALALLADASPWLIAAAVLFVTAESVLPSLTLIAVGHATGDTGVPAELIRSERQPCAGGEI